MNEQDLKAIFINYTQEDTIETLIDRGLINPDMMRNFCIVKAFWKMRKQDKPSDEVILSLEKKFNMSKSSIYRIIQKYPKFDARL